MDTPALIADALTRLRGRPHALPESTYRLQFHAGFTFRDAAAVVPYLHALGVTHCYASPYLRARPGSTHGYDVIDHCQFNPELGGEAGFEVFLKALRDNGLQHILDTVPNHAGVATNENTWWNDVLANGRASPFGEYFDIAWRGSPRTQLHDKVLLPVLGKPYAQALEAGELKLVREGASLFVTYFDRRFPISPETTKTIVGPGASDADVEQAIARLNGMPGDAASFDALDELLSRQHYRLAYWRVAPDEINYRRFFDINDLAALSMERAEVFEATHALIFRLLEEGKLAGLRIDHPDGLFDPAQYFRRLQGRYAAATGTRPDDKPLYVTVEKILAPHEPLPREWPVHGTSGYDFLNEINGLFIDPGGEQPLTRLYQELTRDETAFEDLVYEKKRLILQISLASELQMLAHILDEIAQSHRRSRDFTLRGLHDALREVIACFGVYRSYISADDGVSETDRRRIDEAVEQAVRRNPETDRSVFDFIRQTLLQDYPPGASDELKHMHLRFAGKFQQLTAPATAKGIEDTAFYVYNRMVSLNEVGGEPSRFGVSPDALHEYLASRARDWPYALSALSTHDTKRSEDVRARLNVLSEMPDEWRERVTRWTQFNDRHRTTLSDRRRAPDRNEEYLLYQTLVGAWPLDEAGPEEHATFVKRIGAYMEKALREAKVHTSWTNPSADYDAAVQQFVARVLDEPQSAEFLRDFRPFQQRVARLGLINSIAQTVLRLTAPGVPDTYQGQELWDFSLVDPDNRRPVNYERRREMLSGLDGGSDPLLESLHDGRAKLHVTTHCLHARRENPGLFSAGEYIAGQATGDRAANVFAFARRHGDRLALVAVPRLVAKIAQDGRAPLGEQSWGNTTVRFEAPGASTADWRDVITGRAVTLSDSGVAAAELFRTFPAAVLVGRARQ